MSDADHNEATERERGPVEIYRLGDEPGDDLTETTTPEERLAMLWSLSARMWELTGQPLPHRNRSELPVRMIRLT